MFRLTSVWLPPFQPFLWPATPICINCTRVWKKSCGEIIKKRFKLILIDLESEIQGGMHEWCRWNAVAWKCQAAKRDLERTRFANEFIPNHSLELNLWESPEPWESCGWPAVSSAHVVKSALTALISMSTLLHDAATKVIFAALLIERRVM